MPADLSIYSVNPLAKTSWANSETISVQYVIQNTGSTFFNFGYLYTHFFLSTDNTLSADDLDRGNGSFSANMNGYSISSTLGGSINLQNVPQGNYYIIGRIDYGLSYNDNGNLSEISETNNNFVVGQISVSPSGGSVATTGNDMITMTADTPTIHALAGNDTVIGTPYTDYIYGDEGDDSLYGKDAGDVLYGGLGDDVLVGGTGGDSINGDDGYDTASYAEATTGVTVFLGGNQFNTGEAVGDVLVSIEALIGSNYDDIIGGDGNSNKLYGLAGNDWLLDGGGDDFLYGGDGNDILSGGYGADVMDGGAGLDVAYYRDAISGIVANLAAGQQTYIGGGEAFGDTITNIENIWGSRYGDTLTGTGGANQVYGFEGDDTLFGGGGDDNMYAGTGLDTLTGGAGADTFFFLQYSEGSDHITDFQSGSDRLFASQYWFGLVTPGPAGAINPANFVSGSAPTTTASAPQFLYNTSSSILYFDPDGSGQSAAVQLATFTAGTVLTANDIWRA